MFPSSALRSSHHPSPITRHPRLAHSEPLQRQSAPPEVAPSGSVAGQRWPDKLEERPHGPEQRSPRSPSHLARSAQAARREAICACCPRFRPRPSGNPRSLVPLLRPHQPVTPAQDALLTAIARQARLGDDVARDLLWRAFYARLQPALFTVGRTTQHRSWPRRNGRPWDLDDLRQEAWLVFADLTLQWNGEGSFVPYITAYFPWRLRNAMRHLAPTRVARSACAPRKRPTIDSLELRCAIEAALSPRDVEVLHLRLVENAGIGEIARRLGVNRRTISRRWARICRIAREVLQDAGLRRGLLNSAARMAFARERGKDGHREGVANQTASPPGCHPDAQPPCHPERSEDSPLMDRIVAWSRGGSPRSVR